MLFLPNLLTTSPNNEQHNLENKDLENDKLEGGALFMFEALSIYKFVQCCQL
jgi:hypothetical protein